MCIRICVSDLAHGQVACWDAHEVRVLVRVGDDPCLALAGVATVLVDLGARRTWAGFRCYCGEPVRLPPELDQHIHATSSVEAPQDARREAGSHRGH